MSKTYSAGIVTAYGAAKRAGYQGTYEDFCRQQAVYAESAAAVEQAKQDAQTARDQAQTAKNDAVTAKNNAVSAKDDAVSAKNTAVSAKDDAVSAKNTATTKAQEASASATSAGQSAQSADQSARSAEQSARDISENLEQIHTNKEDIGKLKTDLDAQVGDINYINESLGEVQADLDDNVNFITSKMTKIIGKNKLSMPNVTNGSYIQNGTKTTGINYGYTKEIQVSGGQMVRMYGKNSSETFALIALMRYFTFYDEAHNVISVTNSSSVHTFIAPEGAVSVIVSFNITNAANYHDLMITVGENATEYEPFTYYYIANDDFVPESAVVNKTKLTGYMEENVPVNLFSSGTSGYMTNDGTIGTSSNYFYTNRIPVKKGQSINVYDLDTNDNKTQISRRFLCAFNSSGQAVSASGESASTNLPYIVPEGITEIVISVPCAGNTYATHAVMSETMVCADFEPNWYVPFQERYLVGKEEFVKKAITPYIFLPDVFYVATGKTIEIYNKQVCVNADKFHFRWVSDVGYQYNNKLQLVGTDTLEGTEKQVRLELYDDNLINVWSGKTTIKFVAELTADTKILPIGDSITRAKNWLAEVYNINNHIQMVGTFEDANVVDIDENLRTVHHEGRSGFSAKDYMDGKPYTLYGANETQHNKFWDGSKFSLSHYATTYNITFDAVQIMLGTNGTSMSMEENAENLTAMVKSIRGEYANIPILFVYMPLTGNQNGIGAEQASGSSDGYASTLKGFMQYKKDMEVYNLLTRLKVSLADVSNIIYVPITQCFNRDYNYGSQTVSVIPRSSKTMEITTAAIHPHAPNGYWQMADVLYSAYCALA